ncbi:hypothetical protein BOTBODRAFT_171404 [Botryobasidium botryosum FD-172 SS1]|uniref:Protein kinase domain-containing protein n=1 Tax=Botryobasidium botryosum (strain FD-172 SS1) TaxID=930990 RepID=A0A067MSK1_BOTB1|nr:hypothetical protein BOTBODRAFT_171404 [Botryobasidium botryosum FD-172 SS1]
MSVVKGIAEAWKGIKSKGLRDQCEELVESSRLAFQAIEIQSNCEFAIHRSADFERLVVVLEEIKQAMTTWAGYSSLEGFLRQLYVAMEIGRMTRNLDASLEIFNAASQQALHQMVEEVHSSLSSNDAFQVLLDKYAQSQNQMLVILGELQKLNRKQPHDSAEQTETRGKILRVQSNLVGGGLPNTDLQSKIECEKVGESPAIGAKNYDIYEGIWMGSQKVALKLLRRVTNEGDARKCKRNARLTRQVNIWSQLRNEYIAPLYGVCMDDGPYPYLVMPWYTNGDATQYVQYKDPAIRLKLCLEAAHGLQYLHSLAHPVVHGNLRGSNLLISDDGRALLSNFGFSDITGSENSTTLSGDNLRWMSFEAQLGHRTPDVDVWAWAMTTLELVSEQKPFHTIKMTGGIAMAIKDGARPKMDEYMRNGLMNQELWSLLEPCWSTPDRRPSIDEVVKKMEHHD